MVSPTVNDEYRQRVSLTVNGGDWEFAQAGMVAPSQAIHSPVRSGVKRSKTSINELALCSGVKMVCFTDLVKGAESALATVPG